MLFMITTALVAIQINQTRLDSFAPTTYCVISNLRGTVAKPGLIDSLHHLWAPWVSQVPPRSPSLRRPLYALYTQNVIFYFALRSESSIPSRAPDSRFQPRRCDYMMDTRVSSANLQRRDWRGSQHESLKCKRCAVPEYRRHTFIF